ncbi:patatin-like phospholipase family protein [Acanthopleuribacter pedis]|uniref:Patatin-like phospholipase family protein n=1 Tax=Acanthopleuribacter pedis TaxID=442870 RepID=A0A8J7U7M7_9BACT|nr:patatin-like phospholipase family protein [Acanthopleuribacter pedis]MBO1322693.1 patatin-like phospholipase family protein [Acanthopleuribacter pedis]
MRLLLKHCLTRGFRAPRLRRLPTLLWPCLLLLSATAHPVFAQELPNATQKGPRIGLALSGGGARGYAHLGVLRVLEEQRIPIHAVAGTSMGAMVGGLYAAGLPLERIEAIMADLDWPDLFDDEPARRDRTFRRKAEDQRFLFDFEIGIGRDGVRLPTGLSAGQKLNFFLRRHTLGVAHLADFDQLPIPYRAMGTDIVTGESVALHRGDLAKAIRASMALPGMFAPIAMNDRMFVDGGVVNNLPIQVLKDMDVDVIIAVDIGLPLREREQIITIMDVSSQAMGILSRKEVEQQLELADLLIVPPISDIGTLDFAATAEIRNRGEQAAQAVVDQLTQWSVSESAYNSYQQQRIQPPPKPQHVVSLDIVGLKRVDERVVRGQLRLKPGDPLDLPKLRRDLDRVFGLGDFELVDFQLKPAEGGFHVRILIREKFWGPNYMHFGVNTSIDDDQNTRILPLINLTNTRLNALGAELRTDFIFGDIQRLNSEFYQPLDFGGRFFIAPQVGIDRDKSQLAAGGEPVELETIFSRFTLDLGINLGAYGEFRTRYVTAKYDVDFSPLDSPEANALDGVTLGGISTSLVIDRLDNRAFPKQGMLSTLSLLSVREKMGSDDDFDSATFNLVFTKSFGRHTFLGWLETASGLKNEPLPFYAQSSIGGLFSFSAYEQGELIGSHYAILRPTYLYRATSLPAPIGDGVYLGGWLEMGNMWQTRDAVDFGDLRYTATFTLGADTRVGPVYLAVGIAEKDRHSFYLSIGPSF